MCENYFEMSYGTTKTCSRNRFIWLGLASRPENSKLDAHTSCFEKQREHLIDYHVD